MSDARLVAVITTIRPPTTAVVALSGRIAELGIGNVLVIGDRKGPGEYALDGTEFYSLPRQQGLEFRLASKLPENIYARKNLGYLLAFQRGARCIYETDDDNAPLQHWTARTLQVAAAKARPLKWLNAYRQFSEAHIWPRGFPLDEVSGGEALEDACGGALDEVWAPIQQGLANGSPDVDAVWRLILDREVEFTRAPSLWLPPGSWCPFNSQSTWWWPEAYPLMYLPSHCSFRMTDIWRSYIAQRCLWEQGCGVVFHSAEVFQQRNPHNLMKDFSDEVEGYVRNKELVSVLAGLKLEKGRGAQASNLLSCYRALVAENLFPRTELGLVQAWLADMEALGWNKRASP